MNPDIVSQMGAMLGRGILTAMALVASLTGVILFVETLRRWRNREIKLKGDDGDPEMAPAVRTPLMTFESTRRPEIFGWHRHAAASRLDSNRPGLRIGPSR
jgi:hypothetical protein